MIDREFAKKLIDQMPEDRMIYVVAFLQGAAVPDDTADAEKLIKNVLVKSEDAGISTNAAEAPLSIGTVGVEYFGKEIPYWKKYTLSIEEAAAYFRIGRDKLRKIVNENPDADFILWNNTRAQIKRKKFEAYIDRVNVI